MRFTQHIRAAKFSSHYGVAARRGAFASLLLGTTAIALLLQRGAGQSELQQCCCCHVTHKSEAEVKQCTQCEMHGSKGSLSAWSECDVIMRMREVAVEKLKRFVNN